MVGLLLDNQYWPEVHPRLSLGNCQTFRLKTGHAAKVCLESAILFKGHSAVTSHDIAPTEYKL